MPRNSIRWDRVLRLLSPYDTKVYALEYNTLPCCSFAQLLSQSKGLLRELFSVHLKDEVIILQSQNPTRYLADSFIIFAKGLASAYHLYMRWNRRPAS